MSKIKKIILIILINIILFLVAILISDYLTFKEDCKAFLKYNQNSVHTKTMKFQYFLINPPITYIDLKEYFNGEDNIFNGRKPVGLEYKNKPIVIFGDSFAHGQYLNYNQNFGYKLSHKLKRPVYNRAIPGASLQHMFYQVSEKSAEYFYEQVPKTDTIYYIMINDHYLRMSIFSDFQPLSDNFYLRYTLKNDKLKKDNFNNIFLNLIKSSYTVRNFNCKYSDYYVSNHKNADALTDLALAYFKETRDCLEKKWNNKLKFNIILYRYDKFYYKDLLKQKLVANDFNVIDTDDLTNENLMSEEYFMQDNYHPKEKAWDLLTPKIIKKSLL